MQNRVDPFGNIIATAARGAWMGNRGNIHNGQRQIVRPFKLLAWITCRLEFKGRHREIMKPGQYTELFFLDEATAFAAGHRPCAECRREEFVHFKNSWILGNSRFAFSARTAIADVDTVLQRERMDKFKNKQTHTATPDQLTDGTFIVHRREPYLFLQNHLYHWTPAGYDNQEKLMDTEFTVLTPPSIVNAFRAGYQPQIDISAPRA